MQRVIPLVLALLAAVPEAAFAGRWYRCRYTGETSTSCCCRKEPASCEPVQAQATRADCCDLLRRDPTAITARTGSRTELGAAAIAVAPVPAPAPIAELAPGLVREPAERATAPPRVVEPLYLRHSSLLL